MFHPEDLSSHEPMFCIKSCPFFRGLITPYRKLNGCQSSRQEGRGGQQGCIAEILQEKIEGRDYSEKQKIYSFLFQDDVKSMADNFSEIVKLCRVEEENQVSRATQAEEDALEMQVRASNMVRAGESLMKLVSDLKIYLILNDFPNVNEAISSNSSMFKEMQVRGLEWNCIFLNF